MRATPICRSDVLWERLKERCPAFARDCETKGLRYSHVMPNENDAASGMGRPMALEYGLRYDDAARIQSTIPGVRQVLPMRHSPV